MDQQADDIINQIKAAAGGIKILGRNGEVDESALSATLGGLGLV